MEQPKRNMLAQRCGGIDFLSMTEECSECQRKHEINLKEVCGLALTIQDP